VNDCCAIGVDFNETVGYMKRKKREVPVDVVANQIDATFQRILEENGLARWNRDEMLENLRRMDLSPEEKVARGMTIAMCLGIDSPGNYLAQDITTQEQLDATLETMMREGSKMSTIMKKGLRKAALSIRRRGGPGRSPILNSTEIGLLCDQVAAFIRQKYSTKKSCEETAKLSPTLLGGKKVGARTIQKYWDEREKYPSK
jgi:hypothetical protein